MNEQTRRLLSLLGVIALVSVLSFCAGHRRGARGVNMQRDTVVITKTHTEVRPEFKTEALLRWEPVRPALLPFPADSVEVPVTQIIHDTTTNTVYVPITQRYYERLDGRLRLWVSGYQPTLDRWELDEQTKVIRERKRWGFSVGVGPGVIYTPFHPLHIDAGIGIFGGVTYTF